MRCKSNNTYPMWSPESNIGRTACKHTEEWSVVCHGLLSLHIPSSHLVDRTIQDMTESDCCPALQPFIIILLTTAYPPTFLFDSLLVTHTTPLLLSLVPSFENRETRGDVEGGRT